MTLGEYDYEDLNQNPYASMSKVIFVLFQILIPILLFNMLIAMMGNTYATVNEKSEKEFLKMVIIVYSFSDQIKSDRPITILS